MSKGFLVLAQNNDRVDYLKQAYALALSIRSSQLAVKDISLITDAKVPAKYRKVFDQIIPIPFQDDAKDSEWKIENRWKFYHVSPYDETIVLDVDMLMLEDISLWWDYCANRDLVFCSRIRNHKLDHIPIDQFHRKTFIANGLTNPYFGLHYFRKSQTAYEFYKILEFICNNWNWCYDRFAIREYQNWLSMDLATAIAIEMMGLQETVLDVNSPFEFIHMKLPLQDWPFAASTWYDTVPVLLNDQGELFVGNIKQHKLFHYVEKNFISDSMLKKLQDLAHDY